MKRRVTRLITQSLVVRRPRIGSPTGGLAHTTQRPPRRSEVRLLVDRGTEARLGRGETSRREIDDLDAPHHEERFAGSRRERALDDRRGFVASSQPMESLRAHGRDRGIVG